MASAITGPHDATAKASQRDKRDGSLEAQVLAFWGKTGNGNAGQSNWKPLLHHMIDVAATALMIQQASPGRLNRDAALLEVDPEALAWARALLAGLHDLGKIARAFQAKCPAHFPTAVLGELDAEDSRRPVIHGAVTGQLLAFELPEFLNSVLPGTTRADRWHVAFTVGGHHGRPLRIDGETDRMPQFERKYILDPSAIPVARHACELMWRLLGQVVLKLPDPDDETWAVRVGWGLAGLTTLADWVGSDADFFRFEDPSLPADAYLPVALRAAERAVTAKGLRPAPVSREGGLYRLFDVSSPRPMQRAAEALPLPEGPVLAVIEDVPGTGKTEAALVLAHRMMAAGKAEGVYFALPSMATANAMFDRLHEAHRRLFAADAHPSLALLHGRRHLSERFRDVRLAGSESDDGVAAQCTAWIADDRRRAFFAEVGAGTIDQALLSVLPKKFLALRQHGLAGKVLIVDEAHAYDAYMGEELKRLLQFHGAAGGSAIVLSATLLGVTRAGLVRAYLSGLSADRTPPCENAYPLISLHGAEEDAVEPVEPAASSVRTVAVERLDTVDAAIDAAIAAAGSGAAVAVIRNAVDDAIETHDRMVAARVDSTLFHARFTAGDRMEIERAAVTDFGKGGSRRAGRVLVATQVIEQSLDLDFDLMITDLAPVDLMVQRAGRLWRHAREGRPEKAPRLLVICPDWRAPDKWNWLHVTQPRGAFVYRPGVVWRSAKTLFERGVIDTPAGLRPLIEAAYSDEEPLPDALREADDRWDGERVEAPKAHARQLLINWSDGYAGIAGVEADQEVGTRLGEPTLTLRLARQEGGALRPWIDLPEDPRRAWALSEISVRVSWLGNARPPAALESLIDNARQTWPDFEKALPIGVVDEDGIVRLERSAGEGSFTYDPVVGLRRIEGK